MKTNRRTFPDGKSGVCLNAQVGPGLPIPSSQDPPLRHAADVKLRALQRSRFHQPNSIALASEDDSPGDIGSAQYGV